MCTYHPFDDMFTHLCELPDGHPLILIVVKLFEDLVKVFLRLVLFPVPLDCHKSHYYYVNFLVSLKTFKIEYESPSVELDVS